MLKLILNSIANFDWQNNTFTASKLQSYTNRPSIGFMEKRAPDAREAKDGHTDVQRQSLVHRCPMTWSSFVSVVSDPCSVRQQSRASQCFGGQKIDAIRRGTTARACTRFHPLRMTWPVGVWKWACTRRACTLFHPLRMMWPVAIWKWACTRITRISFVVSEDV